MEFADISDHQAETNILAYGESGTDRILIKATEGSTYANPHYPIWNRLANEIGIEVGAYHWLSPYSDATAQARHFLRVIGNSNRASWVCLDVEQNGVTVDQVNRFCLEMAMNGWPRGVIYGGAFFLGPMGLQAVRVPDGWRQLHLAAYNSIPDDRVTLPAGWPRSSLVARQYTSSARQAGIPGPSDCNRVVREWLTSEGESVMAVADDQIGYVAGKVPGLNPSDFGHAFVELVRVARQLVNDIASVKRELTEVRALVDVLDTDETVTPEIDYAKLAAALIQALNK